MRNFLILSLSLFFSSLVYAVDLCETPRQEISALKKEKGALFLEQKKLLKEVLILKKTMHELSLLTGEKKEDLLKKQEEIFKTLPLLARLERSNPLKMIVDPGTGQYRARGLLLIRFFISSIRHKIQHIQETLNNITITTCNLKIQNQRNDAILAKIEEQKKQLSCIENKKIEKWTKAELERLAKEEDINTLLDESRGTQSQKLREVSAATALLGLPFRKLEQPVSGKIFKSSTLQNKFSPHSQGIFFETEKNMTVGAPAKGKIVFKGPFRTHTEILIIDHGENVHTILMGIHKIDAEVGKNVYTGEKLGTMAGYGSGQPTLYLELRHKGKTIDPTPYFAIKSLEQ